MKVTRFLSAGAAVAAVLAVAAPVSASAAPVPDTCWFHEEGNTAYYRNCASVNHYIKVDKALWPDDYVCVARNSRKELGHYLDIRYAEFQFEGCPV
jgi:uncharacterized protein DUF6355